MYYILLYLIKRELISRMNRDKSRIVSLNNYQIRKGDILFGTYQNENSDT